MTGLTRYGRRSGLIVALGLFFVVTLFASVAAAISPGPQYGAAVAPSVVSGNSTCSNRVPGTTQLKIEPVTSGTYRTGSFTVTITTKTLLPSGGTLGGTGLDWNASSGVVLGAIVKGGTQANLYDYRPNGRKNDVDLHAPVNPTTNSFYAPSHVSFCLTTAAPSFTVDFVDADSNADGTQTHAPANPTGPGYYHVNAKITNNGTGAGAPTLTDKDDRGTIAEMEGCPGVPAGLHTGQASCTFGTLQPGASLAVPITIKLPAVSSSVSNNNTATVSPGGAGSTDSEPSTVSPAEQQCNGQDCIRFWYEPSVGVDHLCTGTVGANNTLAACLTINPSATATDGGERALLEDFISGQCGGRTCDGDPLEGNMIGWGVCPQACGFQQGRVEYHVIPSLIPGFEGTAETAVLLAQLYYANDTFTENFAISTCSTQRVCEVPGSRMAVGDEFSVTIAVSAGDGFTGSCLGRICP
jgi:hypothetical protein